MESNRRRSGPEEGAASVEVTTATFTINSCGTVMPLCEIKSRDAISAHLWMDAVDTWTKSFEASSAKRNDSPSSPQNKPRVSERRKRKRSSLPKCIRLEKPHDSHSNDAYVSTQNLLFDEMLDHSCPRPPPRIRTSGFSASCS